MDGRHLLARRSLKVPGTDRSRFGHALRWGPGLIALLLAAPNISWPFLWDDFEFLNRTALFQPRDLLPRSGAALYRPISQVVYFALVGHLGPASVLIAHLANAAAAVGSVLLLTVFLRRRVGPRAAICGGLILASTAGLPTLVGWASGCQDLLCLLFMLAAFNLADVGRPVAALAALMAAMLAKETAVALAPVVVVLQAQGSRVRSREFRVAAIGTATLLLLWALVHPWTRRALHIGDASPAASYVGFQGAEAIRSGLLGLLSLVNLTWSRQFAWRSDVIALAAMGTVLIPILINRAWRLAGTPEGARGRAFGRAYWLAASLAVLGPFVLTITLVGHWAPYYAWIPATGLAMLCGPVLARRRAPLATAATLAFVWVGVCSRMSLANPDLDIESNMHETASALNRVERGFKALQPALPKGAHVYVYVMAGGRQGVYASLYKDPPLGVWYGDPRIELLDPFRMTQGSSNDFLFWVNPNLEVFEVNVQTLRPRSSGPAISLFEYQKTLRAYASGLAGAGQVDRAAAIFTTMPEYSEALRAMDRRTAAMYLYAAGRTEAARGLLKGAKSYRRVDALSMVASLAAKPVGTLDLSSAALWALGFSPSDTAAVRGVMRFLVARHYDAGARAFARRLAELVPGDPEAERTLRGPG